MLGVGVQEGTGERWVCINKASGGEAGGASLAVQYPADLAWAGITCHVLDQRTLKMKQVRARRASACAPPSPAGHPGITQC